MKSSITCNVRKRFSLRGHAATNSVVASASRDREQITLRHAVFTVVFELMRGNPTGTEAAPHSSRITNTLERAVDISPGCAQLWRLLLHFHPLPSRVIPRALAACPWSKVVAFDCLRKQQRSGADDEAASAASLVCATVKRFKDTGVRVRTPLEEVQLLMTLDEDDDEEEGEEENGEEQEGE